MSVDRTKYYSTEKKILIDFITDDEFCNEIIPLVDAEFLSNDYSKVIFQWCKNYFEEYGKAPNKSIIPIYHANNNLKPETKDIIGTILEHLDQVEDLAAQKDTAYSIQLAKDYFSSKLIELTTSTAQDHIVNGRLSEAKDLMNGYIGLSELNGGVSSNWFDGELTESSMQKMFYPEESHDILLDYPTAFGKFIGPQERGRLGTFLAPMKRGKTWALSYMAFWAARMQVNTLLVSLEMDDADMNQRAISTLTGVSNLKGKQRYYSVFDCVKNQEATCSRRLGQGRAIEECNEIKEYLAQDKHIPCAMCRGTSDFELTTWYQIDKHYRDHEAKQDPAFFMNQMRAKYNCVRPMVDPFLRTARFPTKTATLDTLVGHMEQLRKTEGFNTQFLVIDYADLLKARSTYGDYRHDLDAIWTGMKGLAQERNMLIWTASQTNRGGMSSESVQSDSAAEHIGKIAIADVIIGISQTSKEKQRGVCRLSFADGRHEYQASELFMTQHLASGQFMLDSEIQVY